MEVAVRIHRHVVIDDDIDALDIHSATKNISGDEDSAFETLELIVVLQTIPQQKEMN